ncbi:MAG: transport-associated protein [Bryobacterales bacterium]|jgi:hyperosmotically inducible protein|nr:transport-associated protein [Bryobacterales bacterium]
MTNLRSKLWIGGALLFLSVPAIDAQQAPAKAAQADNTAVNKRDRSEAQPTADQAKNNKSDREIMQQIRKSVVDDKTLSTYAHNVKIIASHGKVTLKGPVHTDDERKNIEEKATAVAGAGNVTNEITVKADTKAKADH